MYFGFEYYRNLFIDYGVITTLEEYQRVELLQRDFFAISNIAIDYHLFTKYYSGTYWSFEQCVWIDALRKVADKFFRNTYLLCYSVRVLCMPCLILPRVLDISLNIEMAIRKKRCIILFITDKNCTRSL